jgi:hypothetical protein
MRETPQDPAAREHRPAGHGARPSFKPTPRHADTLNAMLDQVVSWGTALQSVRP